MTTGKTMKIYWSPAHNDYAFGNLFTNQPNNYHFLVKDIGTETIWIEMWPEFYTNLELITEVKQ